MSGQKLLVKHTNSNACLMSTTVHRIENELRDGSQIKSIVSTLNFCYAQLYI